MLLRFSLYGLLKNQRYFEAFLLLALLDRGISLTQVGVLIAVRELVHGVLEVPSGIAADTLGRRRVMVLAALAYVIAYPIMGLLDGVAWLGFGMALIGFGDAFRSGTHKAMIFDWLAARDRQDERVRVYGRTRSWSKIGSALAAPLAAAIVLVSGDLSLVFVLSTIPAALNLLNLATYPRELEGPRTPDVAITAAFRNAWHGLVRLIPRRPLRRLVLESAAATGLHRSTKDYVQPLLESAALGLPWFLGAGDIPRTAMLVGLVYTALFLLSAVAARQAHRVERWFGDVARATRMLWMAMALCFVLLGVGVGTSIVTVAVAAFVGMAALQNILRPVLLGRFDEHTPPGLAATVLSVESQSASLTAVILAPAIGFAVDLTMAGGTDIRGLWPVAAVGVALAALVALTAGGDAATVSDADPRP